MLNSRWDFRTAAQGETAGAMHAAVRIQKRSLKWTPLTRMLIDNAAAQRRAAVCASAYRRRLSAFNAEISESVEIVLQNSPLRLAM